MSGITYVPAGPEHDVALRRLLREGVMPDRVRLSLEREPQFALGATVSGEAHATVVALKDGEEVGMCSRSESEVWLNGERARLGYLSQLRVAPSERGRLGLLRGGFEACRALERAGTAAFSVTTIVSGNWRVARLLTAGVRGFPRYAPRGELVTFVLGTGRAAARRSTAVGQGSPAGVQVAPAPELATVAGCLERNLSRFQFAPRWTEADLRSPQRCRGLALSDFFVARSSGSSPSQSIRGCVALWDQRAFKQLVVRGYAPLLGAVRPAVNALLPILGWPRLPPAGAVLSQAYLSHLAVDDDDPGVARALIQTAMTEAALRGIDQVLVGLCPGHPLLPVLRELRPLTYRSTIYTVAWPEGEAAVATLDARPPYLELATL